MLIGFSVGTAAGVLGETIGTNFSGLDLASCVIGAGLGAFVTDRYILTPMISTEEKSEHVSTRVGIVLSGLF